MFISQKWLDSAVLGVLFRQYHQFNTLVKCSTLLLVNYLQITQQASVTQRNLKPQPILIPQNLSLHEHMIQTYSLQYNNCYFPFYLVVFKIIWPWQHRQSHSRWPWQHRQSHQQQHQCPSFETSWYIWQARCKTGKAVWKNGIHQCAHCNPWCWKWQENHRSFIKILNLWRPPRGDYHQ